MFRYQSILLAIKFRKSFAKFMIRIHVALLKKFINDEMAQHPFMENCTVAASEHWSFHAKFWYFSVVSLPFFVLRKLVGRNFHFLNT